MSHDIVKIATNVGNPYLLEPHKNRLHERHIHFSFELGI